MEYSAGYDEIFEIGGGGSLKHNTTFSFAKGYSIGFDIHYPPANRPGYVKNAHLKMFWFRPDEDQIKHCYWIPRYPRYKKDKEKDEPGVQINQRPWYLAWSVNSYETLPENIQPQIDEGEIEEEN